MRDVLRLRDASDVLRDRGGDVDDVGGLGADGDLLHVEHGGRVEHRAPLGHGEHRDRAGSALRHEGRAVDRVDRDVAQRTVAVADLLAVVQHGRFVLLALTDHDDTLHRHGADHVPHRVDRGAVATFLVAASDPPAGRHRRGLGDADQFESEVAVRSFAAWGAGRHGLLPPGDFSVDAGCAGRGSGRRGARTIRVCRVAIVSSRPMVWAVGPARPEHGCFVAVRLDGWHPRNLASCKTVAIWRGR